MTMVKSPVGPAIRLGRGSSSGNLSIRHTNWSNAQHPRNNGTRKKEKCPDGPDEDVSDIVLRARGRRGCQGEDDEGCVCHGGDEVDAQEGPIVGTGGRGRQGDETDEDDAVDKEGGEDVELRCQGGQTGQDHTMKSSLPHQPRRISACAITTMPSAT